MSQFIELKKNERKFEVLELTSQVIEIVKNNYKNLTLYIKFDTGKTVVQVSQIHDDNSIDIITDPGYIPENNKIVLYGLLEKYLEFELDVLEIIGPGLFKCKIAKFKKAAEIRKELRLKVNSDQVIASNFMLSKHAIDISNFKIPTTIKVLLDQFHSENSNICDILKVDIYDQNDPLLEKIRKNRKMLFIQDLNNPDKTSESAEDLINYNELIEENISEYIKKNIEKGFKSIIIAPLIYITDSENPISFAYAQLNSKTKLFSIDDVNNIKKLLEKLVSKIKDANTISIQVNQEIMNLSKSGAKLYITDDNLKKYLIATKGFTFNIVFKLQAPITIYGEVKNIYKDEEDKFYIGIAFAGHSSRKDEMKRYFSYLEPMIKKYKEQLLQLRKIQVQKAVN